MKGDTDDDVSLHLNSKVGPARPLRRKLQTEQEISKILNNPSNSSGTKFEQLFENYQKNGGIITPDPQFEPQPASSPDNDYDSQDADSEVESEADIDESDDATEVGSGDEKSHTSPVLEPKKSDLTPVTVASFLLSFTVFLLLVVYLFTTLSKSTHPDKPIENYYEVNSKFQSLDSKLSEYHDSQQRKIESVVDILDLLTAQQASLQDNHNALEGGIISHLKEIRSKIDALEAKDSSLSSALSDFEGLKTKVENLDLVSNTTEFDQRLDSLNDKLDKLSNLNDNIEQIKHQVLTSLTDKLPDLLPVHVKNGRIHYSPEFNKVLYNFIDSYFKENLGLSWDEFISNNQQHLNSYIGKILEESGVSGVNKDSFHKILDKKLKENNKIIFDRFNNLVDHVNVDMSNFTIPKEGDKILLSSLLDVFSKGSITTNFADYKLGARILGFLTTLPNDERSLPRKLLLGWYDLIKDSTPNPKSLLFNANNLLLDSSTPWKCETDKQGICSVGIRLSTSVVVSDLVVETGNQDNLPDSLSIYVRPSSKQQYNLVIEYLNDFKIKFNLPLLNNKYLKKFVKVKEAPLKKDKINHLNLPTSLINLRMPTKDLYIEFHGNKRTFDITNIKVYGISEYNAYKYGKQFDSVIESLEKSVIDDYEHPFISEDYELGVLGDDELMFE